MAGKLLDQLGGIISLRLMGKHPEKVINKALARGIFIWDIKREDELVYLKVRSTGFDALKSIARELGQEVEILDQKGLPFYKNIVKRRLGFLGGALIFVLALYLMSSFVWFVEVTGNQKLASEQILATAEKYGIYQGAAKWNFSRREVEEAMLRDLSQISYVQCDIRGVKARIKVVEKVLPRQDITGSCHIVAAKDGVVEQVLVLEGQAEVKEGDVVGKGEILISGIVFPQAASGTEAEEQLEIRPYPVRARGQVKARVWYEGYGECSLRLEKKVFTGKKSSNIYFITPWEDLLIKGSARSPFPIYQEEKYRKTLHTPLGDWGIFKITKQEQELKISEYKEQEAVEAARQKALQSLRKRMQEPGKIYDSHVDILSSPSDSIVRVKVSVETTEDIALPQEIDEKELIN